MRIHSLQHVEFEGLANIEVWARAKGHSVSKTLLYENEKPPLLNEFDWLVIMGGPMNIYEEERYPWLVQEKKLIEDSIAGNKFVLGICLGAQLIANVLGARIFRNAHKEIGWHPVRLTESGKKSAIFRVLPETFIPFHWHGDTFELPEGAILTAKSEGCSHQAFEYNGRVIGLQFHLESSDESIRRLMDHCENELIGERYIQTKNEIAQSGMYLQQIEKLAYRMLDGFESEAVRRFGDTDK